jgi:TPR repeat protein
MVPHDESFLRRVRTTERVARLSVKEVQTLRDLCHSDPYAAYGYARWLWTMQPTRQSAAEARELLLRLTHDGQAPSDAEAALAITYRYGGCAAWDDVEVDTRKYVELLDNALAKGSLLAAIVKAKDRIWGNHAEEEPERVAEETERRLCQETDSDPIWHRILAYAYDKTKRNEEAIRQYESAIEAGDTDAYADLGWTYMLRGNMALGDEMMEQGLEQGVASCHLWQTDMSEEDFDELPADEQQQFHETIKQRTTRGLALGESICAYYLGQRYLHGGFGFQPDPLKALAYLERGILLGDSYCPGLLAELMEDEYSGLPAELRYDAEQIAGLHLTAVRRAPNDGSMLGELRRCCDMGLLLRYQPEIQREWQPLFTQVKPEEQPQTPIIIDEDDGRWDAYV